MSVLDSASLSKAFSFLPSLSQIDPTISRSSFTGASQTFQAGFFRELEYCEKLGEGAVFLVSLYQHKVSGHKYAVKKTKARKKKDGDNLGGAILAALTEIHVIWHAELKRHESIVRIFSWDWSELRLPVVFAEFAPERTLKEFLRNHCINGSLKRELCLDVAAGLHALHAYDVAHGDVKLSNTLVFPDTERKWRAKISDFSHSVFGISARRKSTYPGSGLYNAPEIRSKEVTIFSDLLPKCETFSFGLLIWEVLRDGLSFFDGGWLKQHPIANGEESLETESASGGNLGTLNSADKPCEDHTKQWVEHATRYMDSLPRDTLLHRAQACLSSMKGLSPTDQAVFWRVLQLALKDNSTIRAGMDTVTETLDYYSRATIMNPCLANRAEPISCWAMDPFDTSISFEAQSEAVNEIFEVLKQPIQPSHAEYHLVLSRSYAEGYGVPIDTSQMIFHLAQAANCGSIEGRFLFEEVSRHHNSTISRDVRSETLSIALDRALNRVAQSTSRSPNHGRPRYAMKIEAWNEENSRYSLSRHFVWNRKSYAWQETNSITEFLALLKDNDTPISEATISYEALDSSYLLGPYLEVCCSIGALDWLRNSIRIIVETNELSVEALSATFYRLLLEATRHGREDVTRFLLGELDELKEKCSDHAFPRPYTTGATPLHFLVFFTNKTTQRDFGIRMRRLGIDIESAIPARSWLSPVGFEMFGSALQMAIQVGCFQTVSLLVELGASPLASSVKKQNPLELAVSLCIPKILRVLIIRLSIKPRDLAQYAQNIFRTTPKGQFDAFLLADSPDRYELNFLATLHFLGHTSLKGEQQTHGKFTLGESTILEALQSGSKSDVRIKLLERAGASLVSLESIVQAIELASRRISDDPQNRGLLRTVLTIPSTFEFLQLPTFLEAKLFYEASTERFLPLMDCWIVRNLIYNLADLIDLIQDMPSPHAYLGLFRASASKAIELDNLEAFQLLREHTLDAPWLHLSQAVEHSAIRIIRGIITGPNGTIYCASPQLRYTVLHACVYRCKPHLIGQLFDVRVDFNSVRRANFDPGSPLDIQLPQNNILYPFSESFDIYHLTASLDTACPAMTALEAAVMSGCEECVKELLRARASAQPFALRAKTEDEMLTNVLNFAIRHGISHIASILAEDPSCPTSCRAEAYVKDLHEDHRVWTSLVMKHDFGWNHIFEAIYFVTTNPRQLSNLRELLVGLKRASYLGRHDRTVTLWNGWTPMHYAIFCGRLDVVKLCFEYIYSISPLGTKTIVHDLASNTEDSLALHIKSWQRMFDYSKLYLQTKAGIFPSSRGLVTMPHWLAVHDLLWKDKTFVEMASDLVRWHDWVQVPDAPATHKERIQILDYLQSLPNQR